MEQSVYRKARAKKFPVFLNARARVVMAAWYIAKIATDILSVRFARDKRVFSVKPTLTFWFGRHHSICLSQNGLFNGSRALVTRGLNFAPSYRPDTVSLSFPICIIVYILFARKCYTIYLLIFFLLIFFLNIVLKSYRKIISWKWKPFGR